MTRILSVRMPWAALIIDGSKWVENRSWQTGYRGRIGIHASTQLAKGPGVPTVTSRMDRDRGHIIGTVRITGVHEASIAACALNDCAAGGGMFPGDPLLGGRFPLHWTLADPRPLVTPFHAKGALSLWHADERTAHLLGLEAAS